MKIGIFDSGIGGITVLHQALKQLPNEDYIYYADTLNVPYGEKPKEEVKQYIFEGIDFIARQGVKAIVIACNTATSVAVEDLRAKYTFPILGIEPAVKPAVQTSEAVGKRVLVLATSLTLKEKKFHDLVGRIDSHAIVDKLPLPNLVQFAERFQFDEEDVMRYLEDQLSSFDLNQYGTVVLGCTHFPFFKGTLKKLLPQDVVLVDGSIGTVKNLKRVLEAAHRTNEGKGEVTFYASGVKVEDEAALSRYHQLLEMLNVTSPV